MRREEMGIVNGNPMGMGISMVGVWEWDYGNGNGSVGMGGSGSLKGIPVFPAHLYCKAILRSISQMSRSLGFTKLRYEVRYK